MSVAGVGQIAGPIIRCASKRSGIETLLDLSYMPGAISVLPVEHQSVLCICCDSIPDPVWPGVSGDLREIQRCHEEHGRDNSQHGASAQRIRLESNCKGGWHTS